MKRDEALPVYLQTGRMIQDARRRRDWTQERLASELDVTVKYLQRMEGGRANLSLRSLMKLCIALDVTLHELVPDVPGKLIPGDD